LHQSGVFNCAYGVEFNLTIIAVRSHAGAWKRENMQLIQDHLFFGTANELPPKRTEFRRVGSTTLKPIFLGINSYVKPGIRLLQIARCPPRNKTDPIPKNQIFHTFYGYFY
jgi:hypothetical protein